MQRFAFQTRRGCFLIAAMLLALRAAVTAQDSNSKQPAPTPAVEAPAPETILTKEAELEFLDNKIRESAGKDSDAYLSRGQLNQQLKQRHRVVDDLEQFERLGGKDAELHALRGEAKMQTGDYAGALRDFQAGALLGNSPGYRHAQYVLALHFTGNSPQALTELNQAIKADPENTGNYDVRGIIHRHHGKRAAAMKDHDQSIKLSPDNAYGFIERACTNFAFGDYAAAKRDYEKAIQLGATDAYLYRNFAFFLATCGDEHYRDAPRALQLAGVALEIDPNDGFALHAKACALALLGEYEVAVAADLRARENREFANDSEIGGGVEAKDYLAAWKQGKPLFRTPDKEQ
jgi:tetratricopeptide (TPR) repeat protein